MAIGNLTESNLSLAGLKTTADSAIIVAGTITNLLVNLNSYLNESNIQKLEKLQISVSDFLHGIGLNGGLAISKNSYANDLVVTVNALVNDINVMIADAIGIGNTAKATFLTNALASIEPLINDDLAVINYQMSYVNSLLSTSLTSLDNVVNGLSELMLGVAEVSTIANTESIVSSISTYPAGLSTIADSVNGTNSAQEAATMSVNLTAGPALDSAFEYTDRAVTETGNAKDRLDVEITDALADLETQINALQDAITTASSM